MIRSLGSRTSGVDGSSEGGRINTINLSYQGDEPVGVPERWQGRRVVLKKAEPPAPGT